MQSFTQSENRPKNPLFSTFFLIICCLTHFNYLPSAKAENLSQQEIDVVESRKGDSGTESLIIANSQLFGKNGRKTIKPI
jgi:hypothetical protein